MKSRFGATSLLVFFFLFASACASLGRFGPAHDSFDRGLTLFNQGHYAAAVPYFEAATREDPEFAQAYFYLGRSYVSQSQWRQAIPPLRSAFRLSPREAQGEIMNVLLDAMFAAALNDFHLGDQPATPRRFRESL